MSKLSLERQIYLCKYYGIDKSLYTTIKVKEDEAKEIISELKQKGLYEKYKNMPEEEYEKIINEEKRNIKQLSTRKEKATKNKLVDLNNYLFMELEKLMNNSLSDDELDRELKISRQVVNVSQTIINNANLLLQAKKHFDKEGFENNEIAPLLSLGEKND